MNIDLNKIEPVFAAPGLNAVLPLKVTSLLAEDLGFHIGDGCMAKYQESKGNPRCYFCYYGNATKDLNYFKNVLIPRKKELFDLDLHFNKSKLNHSIYVKFYSKKLWEYFKFLGIPSGKKLNVDVPEIIKNSDEEIKAGFLRGILDSDGCVIVKKRSYGTYPTINIVSSSKILINSLCDLINSFEIDFFVSTKKQNNPDFKKQVIVYAIEINGRKRLKKWFKLIGSSNERNLKKYHEAIETWENRKKNN
jgi:intein/homing endonuclease